MNPSIPKALFFRLVLFVLHLAHKRPTPAPARQSLFRRMQSRSAADGIKRSLRDPTHQPNLTGRGVLQLAGTSSVAVAPSADGCCHR